MAVARGCGSRGSDPILYQCSSLELEACACARVEVATFALRNAKIIAVPYIDLMVFGVAAVAALRAGLVVGGPDAACPLRRSR